MHESRLVADLIASVESEVDPARTRVLRLSVRVGPMCTLSPSALQAGLEHRAAHVWGYAPSVEVHSSEGLDDPTAMQVTLVSIRVED